MGLHTEKEHDEVVEEIADWVIRKLREAPDGDAEWASDLLEDAAERADEIWRNPVKSNDAVERHLYEVRGPGGVTAVNVD